MFPRLLVLELGRRTAATRSRTPLFRRYQKPLGALDPGVLEKRKWRFPGSQSYARARPNGTFAAATKKWREPRIPVKSAGPRENVPATHEAEPWRPGHLCRRTEAITVRGRPRSNWTRGGATGEI